MPADYKHHQDYSLIHPRPKRDYSLIRKDVIEAYKSTCSVSKVARRLRIAPAAVSAICKEENLIPERYLNRKPKAQRFNVDPESCQYCRKYSRTSMSEGYCLAHHRSVYASAVEHCFKP